jgi:hypothetical protein
MNRKLYIQLFFIALAYLFVFSITYKALENQKIYSFFSSFMSTYENQNGIISAAQKPFVKIADSAYVTMDAAHYSYIKDHLYTADPNDVETNYNYGFFPLFPIVWKFFSGLGIVTFNYFLHFASIILLAFAFCKDKKKSAIITVLALPTLTVFLLPYTEALFMFSVSLAMFGYKNENKVLYIIGLIMASATRPVFLLFLGTLIVTEIYQFLRNQKVNYKNLLLVSSIVLSVTFLISIFQQTFHNGSLFTFMSVQKHWGTFFRIPETISDWSMEGFGMNVWALSFCFVFGGTALIFTLFKRTSTNSTFDYWYYFSWIYLLATCIYVLLFQGGCLHSLYRYTLCSPFFYIILFQHLNNEKSLLFEQAALLFVCFFVTCFAFFFFVDYPHKWDFSKTGFVLLTLNLLFFIFNAHLNNRFRIFGYLPLIMCSIFWNCYLYNMFFSKAWIFL